MFVLSLHHSILETDCNEFVIDHVAYLVDQTSVHTSV